VIDADDAGDSTNVTNTGIDCAKLQAEWPTFVGAHRGCRSNEECIFVGGSDGLNQCLTASIGNAGRDAIALDAVAEATRRFLNDFYGSACADYRSTHKTADAGPSKNLRCENGACTADLQFCNSDPREAGVTILSEAGGE
jgi:hypothetical protein